MPQRSALAWSLLTALSLVSVRAGATPHPLFTAPYLSFPVGAMPLSVAVADVNGDAIPDAAVANSDTTVSVLLGRGDGTFAPQTVLPVSSRPSAVAFADLDADGRPDLVVARGDSVHSSVSVRRGNGDGSFGPASEFATGKYPTDIAVGDLNGDGRTDVVVPNGTYKGDNTVSVLLGNGDGTFAPHVDFAAGSQPQAVAIGDLNFDSKRDLIVADATSNSVSVLDVAARKEIVKIPVGKVPKRIICTD